MDAVKFRVETTRSTCRARFSRDVSYQRIESLLTIRCRHLNLGAAGLVAEPGALAFGELPGFCFDEGSGFFEGKLIIKVVHDLFVADRLACGGILSEAGFQ